MDEITVLDYFKFKLNPKNWNREILPERSETDLIDGGPAEAGRVLAPSIPEKIYDRIIEMISHRSVLFIHMPAVPVIVAFLLAFIAQCFLEPSITGGTRNPIPAVVFYSVSAILLILAFISGKNQSSRAEPGDRHLAESPDTAAETKRFDTSVRYKWLGASGLSALIALLLFGGNRFTFINVFFWIASIIFGLTAFGTGISFADIRARFCRKLKKLNSLSIRLSSWTLIWTAVFGICVYFRFYQINNIPGDMFSDHAEKLYDVMDVLDGKTPIFFIRNSGREAFQFYWTVLMIKLFGTGVSFLSLKIGTVLAGLFALPYVYLLGKFVGNRWVGLFAMLLCGVAYWPNVIRGCIKVWPFIRCLQSALYKCYRINKQGRKDLFWRNFSGNRPCRVTVRCGSSRLFFIVISCLLDFLPKEPGKTRPPEITVSCILLFFMSALFGCFGICLMRFLSGDDRLGETETALSHRLWWILFEFVEGDLMPF